jgi:hypothetical protein
MAILLVCMWYVNKRQIQRREGPAVRKCSPDSHQTSAPTTPSPHHRPFAHSAKFLSCPWERDPWRTRCMCGWIFVDGVGQVPVLDLGSVASSGLRVLLFTFSWLCPGQVSIVLLIDHRHIKAQSWHYQPESVKQHESVKLPAHSQRDVYQLPAWKAYFVCIWWWHRVWVVHRTHSWY